MKRKGTVLIEVVAGLFIITLSTTFIINANLQNNKILKERILLEDVSRSMYNLMNEIKYNVPKSELDESLINEEVGFEYDSDFSRNLIYLDYKNIARGNDIKLIKLYEDNIGTHLKIVSNIKKDNNEIFLEKEFIKSWWMDEI